MSVEHFRFAVATISQLRYHFDRNSTVSQYCTAKFGSNNNGK
jgi:hypothetical protein